MLGNSVAVIESYLAAVRASAVGVPVAPQSSDAELAHILQDSGAVCVITDVGHVDQLRRVAGRRDDLIVVLTGAEPVPSRDLFRVLRFDELATTTPATPARDDLGLDDVAWMLYTSGTTGRPKGVLSSQRNCLWSVAACYVPVLGLSPEDRVLWPLPLFHSLAHILCLHGVVAAGAMARIVDGFAADEILQLLRAEPYTFLVGVPTMYRYLIDEARHAGLHTEALRICLVTGAVTAPALSKSFEDTFGIRLIDSYGSTETCGAITMNRPTGAQVPGSCGQVVPGLKVRVVDPDTGRDVQAGTEGEVRVSGPNVMIGYHGQPEASAAALTDGWYRTGDLARRDELGYLTITGRIKELIIRAGENIHPAEVEEVVRTVNGVADVAVVAKPHDDLGEVPVAYVVAENPGAVDTDRIFAACRERLSHFKVPEEVYEISAIPRTASGKIARHRLLEQPARFCAARDAKQESLFRVDWVPVPADATAASEHWAVVGDGRWGDVPVYQDLDALAVALDGGVQAPGIVLAPLGSRGLDDASALVDVWVADDRFADARLVVVTRGAVSVGGEDVPNFAHASVWGLVRSARVDHPDRFGLLDLLDEDVSGDVVCALAAGEPELAVRNGVFRAPRLAGVKASAKSAAVWDKAGSVLLVGASSGAAGSVAKHLAATHHVRHLLFVETGDRSRCVGTATGRRRGRRARSRCTGSCHGQRIASARADARPSGIRGVLRC
jgi:acyl-CoA synthetase (AMP-forming)/AMP-acid ligase II